MFIIIFIRRASFLLWDGDGDGEGGGGGGVGRAGVIKIDMHFWLMNYPGFSL